MEFQVRCLALFLLFLVTDDFEWFWKESLCKNIIIAGVPQASILGPTLLVLYINDFPDDVICDIAVFADDVTLYSMFHRASDLWQQLELASELESDLRDTVDLGKKWLVDSNARKTRFV